MNCEPDLCLDYNHDHEVGFYIDRINSLVKRLAETRNVAEGMANNKFLDETEKYAFLKVSVTIDRILELENFTV